MALARLTACALVLAGCGGADRSGPRAPLATAPSGKAAEYASDDASWGKFHSKRFLLSVPLPDGRAWKIDDHHGAELVAVHAATSSKLSLVATREEGLMNRARCEARARASGLVPAVNLATVEDDVHVGPDAYDSRVWVALDPGKPGAPVRGHVFLFGAFLRQCLLVHLETEVPSSNDEGVLASRLAVASSRIVKAIVLDPPRVTDDAVVPRDKPNIRR